MIKNTIRRFQRWYQGLPDKKRWIDVITALLTVPVLLTVVISNLLTIQNKKNGEKKEESTESTQPINITLENPNGSTAPIIITPDPEDSPTPAPSCKNELPEFEIISPTEGEIMDNDPVCIVHAADGSGYCLPSWSYRINGSSWSPYTDQPICLYNMANGDIEFELRVKSESGETKTYTRNFIYERVDSSSPSPSPIVTPEP